MNKLNNTYERFLFSKIFESANLKFEDFLNELLNKNKTCQFGYLDDSSASDKIVIDIYSDYNHE